MFKLVSTKLGSACVVFCASCPFGCACVCVCVCVCVCGVTECPVTNLFFVSRGWQQGRESATNEDTLVTLVKQLETSSCVPAMVVQSPFGPLFLSLCVLHVNSVTFSPLEGNRVPCEPKLIILDTFRLYSKLTSCTRKVSTLHLEFKCVHPIRGESSGVPIE